jgi:hypothetical protein
MSVLKFRNGLLNLKNGFLNLKKGFLNFNVEIAFQNLTTFIQFSIGQKCSQILKCDFNKDEIWVEIRENFPDFCLTFLNFSLTLEKLREADAKFLCNVCDYISTRDGFLFTRFATVTGKKSAKFALRAISVPKPRSHLHQSFTYPIFWILLEIGKNPLSSVVTVVTHI